MAQTLPSDLENKIAQFRQAVYEMRLIGDFEYDLTANMDETPVFFDMVPSKTVNTKGKKSIRAHLTILVQNSFRRSNTSVLVIPGRCTSVLQPLDVCINKPVKSVLRKCWETDMIEQVDTIMGHLQADKATSCQLDL